MISILFISAQALCLFWLILKRYQFPFFIAALAAWVSQSAIVTMGPQYGDPKPEVDAWLRSTWAPAEMFVLAVTAISCFEGARKAREWVQRGYHRFVAFSAASGLGIAAIGIVAVNSHYAKGADWYERFRQVRGLIWLMLTVYMAVTILLLLKRNTLVPSKVWFHLGLLTIVLAAHAALCGIMESHPENGDAVRALAREIFRGTVIIACVGFIWNAAENPRAFAPLAVRVARNIAAPIVRKFMKSKYDDGPKRIFGKP